MRLFQKKFSSSSFRVNFLLIAVAIIYCVIIAFRIGDFKVFLGAAQLLADGKPIYNVWIEQNTGNYCLYFYSPLFALLLVPFTKLPFYFVNLTWLLLNLFFVYRIWCSIKQYVNIDFFENKKKIWFVVLSFLPVLRFMMGNFEMAQMTIFLLWASLECLDLFDKKKILFGSLLLALAINIKLMPVVLLPYLLYRSMFKETGLTILWLMVFTLLPALFIGWELNQSYLSAWFDSVNPLSNERNIGETGLGTHSLTSLIPPLLMEMPGEIAVKRNLLNLNPDTVWWILNLTRGFLILSTVWFLRSLPFKKAANKLHNLYELSYILLLVPLIFPHQQKYNFFFALPASVMIVYYLFIQFSFKKTRPLIIASLLILSFILSTLTTDGIVGKELSAILQHFKIATYGMLLMAVCLFLIPFSFVEGKGKI